MQHGVRDNANIVYSSALGVIFGVKKYANELMKVIERKSITVNFKTNLLEVDHLKKQATFDVMEENRTESVEVIMTPGQIW